MVNKEWSVCDKGNLFSDDFTHDVMLRVDGDFANLKEKVAYAQRLADKLNYCPEKDNNPDLFWSVDNPQAIRGSIHEVIHSLHPFVGQTIEIHRAKFLESVLVEVTEYDETIGAYYFKVIKGDHL